MNNDTIKKVITASGSLQASAAEIGYTEQCYIAIDILYIIRGTNLLEVYLNRIDIPKYTMIIRCKLTNWF